MQHTREIRSSPSGKTTGIAKHFIIDVRQIAVFFPSLHLFIQGSFTASKTIEDRAGVVGIDNVPVVHFD